MKVRGLEGALVSHKPITIGALSVSDERSYAVNIAGPAALLVAKVHKIAERVESNDARRIYDKDAFDVYRILRSVEAAELAAEARNLLEREISRQVTADALSSLRELFGHAEAVGTQMVVRYVEGFEDPGFMAVSAVSLSQDLLDSTSG